MRIHRLLTASFLVTALVAAFSVTAPPAGAVLQGANGRVAFVSDRSGKKQIYTSRADGTGLQGPLTSLGNNYDPAFSSDGASIAFISDRTGTPQLFTMSANGGSSKRLTSGTIVPSHPTWDPPSKQIAFAGLSGIDSDIYVMQATGGTATDITPDTANFDANPSWSPGGLNIAFDRTVSGATNVWTVQNDGTNLKQLTATGTDSNPAYGPDNKTLAFQSGRDNLPPAPSLFAAVQKPVGIAFTSTQMLVTQENKDKVLAVDSSGVSSTYATLPPTGNQTLERYIAVSPGLGGFTAGDVFVTVKNQIWKITDNGQTVTLFATILALPNSNNFLVFDKVGTFQNKLIVVGGQKSKVFSVDSTGTQISLVIDMHNVTSELEGADVAPLSWNQTYGGDLIVASKFDNTVYAITPPPSSTYAAIGNSNAAEDAVSVPGQVCDYGLSGGSMFFALEDNNGGEIWKVPGSMLGGVLNQFLVNSEADGSIDQAVSDGTNVVISPFLTESFQPDAEQMAFAPCSQHNGPATGPSSASAGSVSGSQASGPYATCPLCPHEIYKMQAKDGSGLVRLTNNTTDDGHPAWSSDGTQIVFQGDRDDPNQPGCESTLTCKYEIYTMSSVDGSGQTNISNSITSNDSSPDWEGLSYPPVIVTDFAFTPSTAKPAQGGSVLWDFKGPSDHTATDNSGFSPHLFDSGTKHVDGYFVFKFIAAGQYPYNCTIHPTQMSGTIKVPIKASPKTGDLSTVFTITWASNAPPPGWVFDVQIERPGGTFTDWLTNSTLTAGQFVADAGAGTYGFQGRYKQTATGAASLYSAPVFITVTG